MRNATRLLGGCLLNFDEEGNQIDFDFEDELVVFLLACSQTSRRNLCECCSIESYSESRFSLQYPAVRGSTVASLDLIVSSPIQASCDTEMCFEVFCFTEMKVRANVVNFRARACWFIEKHCVPSNTQSFLNASCKRHAQSKGLNGNCTKWKSAENEGKDFVRF